MTATELKWQRWLAQLVGLVLIFLIVRVPMVQAAPSCHTVDNHQICILKITRSAKYYWEYRAVVQIDDKRRPMARYNCRTHDYIRRDGELIPNDIAAQVICSFFKQ